MHLVAKKVLQSQELRGRWTQMQRLQAEELLYFEIVQEKNKKKLVRAEQSRMQNEI